MQELFAMLVSLMLSLGEEPDPPHLAGIVLCPVQLSARYIDLRIIKPGKSLETISYKE